MAANQALIQASRGTGEQFIDYGAVLQPVVKGMMRELEIADNKMASFVNSLPPGANIEKLPQGMRPEVERYLRDSKNEYAEAAKVASKLSPSDAGYREAVDKMNSIKTGFMNLNKNLEAHLANRVEFIQDKDDLSTSLRRNDNVFLTSVYAGDYDGFKVTGGELEFLDKSTNKYRRNSEFPQYSLTDVVGADGVAKIFDTERNLGNKGLGWDPKRSGREVNRLFKKVGSQGVIDMAFDGFDEYDGNYIDTVVKEQLAPKMSMQDWLVSDQRDNLKTKEGFSPYKAGFQNFISDVVKDGYDEGKVVYNKRINLDGDKTKSFKAVNNAINQLLNVDKLELSDLLSLTLPSDRKFAERDGNFVILDSSGYDIPGTEFSPSDKKAMRNALQFAVNLPVQFRSTGKIASTSGFDFNAGLSADTTNTNIDIPIPTYNTPKT
jgi:hypothetical protein